MDNESSFYCRVCGLFQDQDVPPWGFDGNSPSFDICGCCGAEFGFDDCFPGAVKEFRAKWLEKGSAWRFPEEKPPNWSLEEQLKNVPIEYL
jgi:hypothetical protein